ncbi:FIST C-terminal domain-containing protein [Pseudanabaena sp. FACHB-1277]|jgi:small ligand-binding sensory domain FIST|uniref:FIST C-terminal domain-containing protein n=1 Tax=Pseudanabaena cinerea FACHB-1277 TaxID=2949581 RepID=A0A926Z656_9CYAN|nr:FIST N-terminal domain-containing protein [Pseudanabaena cinerea]MBD2150322.1 FIST C-terminal domain-containing protein [Pseudanabaena cinerea FACHB-1277]
MKWVTSLSTKISLEAAVQDLSQQVLAAMGDQSLDLGFLFVSTAFASDYPRLLPLLAEKLAIKNLIGCSGGGIVGNTQEFEDKPAIALLIGHLPKAECKIFHIGDHQLPDLDSPPDRWEAITMVDPSTNPNFVLLGDPFSFPISDLIQGLDFAYPNAVKVGGLASSGGMGANALFCFHDYNHYKLYRTGLLGVAIWGDVVIDPVVAQGCRPIGKIFQVSECERNLILGLEGKPPLTLLQDTVGDLSQSDRELAQHSLFIGVVMNEFKANPSQGDFLIRNIIGVDPRSGAIAVGDRIRPGQRVQLHLRDSKASAEDINEALVNYTNQLSLEAPNTSPSAALMFACMGRGERLYGRPNFDVSLLQKHLGEQYAGLIPAGGFFCSGEIGPVGGTTFLHGYTSVLGIFRSKSNQ